MIRLLALLLLAAPLRALEPNLGPAASAPSPSTSGAAATADKISSSLFFRGEVADDLIAAGLAGRLVDLRGLETHAELRSAVMEWVGAHPAEAARLYSGGRPAGGLRSSGGLDDTKRSWKLDEGFVSLVKELNRAAADKGVSDEEMELAAKRLYEGELAEPEAGPVRIGAGGAGSAAGASSLVFADRKLNASGLARETASAGAWLEAAKGPSGRGPAGLERPYGEAVAAYGAFLVSASAVKGRMMTGAEAGGLETARAALRLKLAALALRARCADLEAMAARLDLSAPGAAELKARLLALRDSLSAAAGQAGSADLEALAALARRAEREFSAAYLHYCAYSALLSLRGRAAGPGFSCLYDYLLYRWLAAFFPRASYAAARAELAAAGPMLDEALRRAGSGDPQGALSGLGPRAAALAAAAENVSRASAFNRAAQFFQWGMFFRPAEVAVTAEGGRVSMRPVFAFAELRRGGTGRR